MPFANHTPIEPSQALDRPPVGEVPAAFVERHFSTPPLLTRGAADDEVDNSCRLCQGTGEGTSDHAPCRSCHGRGTVDRPDPRAEEARAEAILVRRRRWYE